MHKIGFGTAAIGRPHYINIRQEDAPPFEVNTFTKTGIATLEQAYQLGIRYFDTAPGYGIAEELMVEWLKTKEDPTIEVATKWGYTYTAKFDPEAEVHEVKDHGLAQLNCQWEDSQELLPFLTTLQIHSATFETGVLENREVLDQLFEIKQQGILIGLTTSGHNQVDVLRRALEITYDSTPLFTVAQVTYNVLEQSLKSLLPEIQAKGVRLVIKEALANGRLFPNPEFPHYTALYSLLTSLAKKYDVGIDAIALDYVYQTISPFKVLSGAATVSQLEENLKTEHFDLDPSDVEALDTFGITPEKYWQERKQLTWN